MNLKDLTILGIDGDRDVVELRSLKDQLTLDRLAQEHLRTHGEELKWLFFAFEPYNAHDGETIPCKTLKGALAIRRRAIKRDPYGDQFAMAEAYAVPFVNRGRPYKPGEYAY